MLIIYRQKIRYRSKTRTFKQVCYAVIGELHLQPIQEHENQEKPQTTEGFEGEACTQPDREDSSDTSQETWACKNLPTGLSS